jgi:hypothetical protein
MWKAFPNEPRIKRFVRGHFYHIEIQKSTPEATAGFSHVVEFKRTVHPLLGKIFYRIASKNFIFMSEEFFVHDYTLKNSLIKEVKVKDLPLYVSWHTYSRFVELLRGEPRKTRVLSKSSKVISRRQEYEAKRIAREVKSVKLGSCV